jgi:hypothetical protein
MINSPVDSSSCAARFPVAAQVEISEGTALVDVSRKDEDAVHFNGQDPQGRAPLFDSPRLRIGSLGTLNLPLLHGESSESPRVTQNDIVVLAGERGTWQVVAPVNGRKADIRRREGFDIRVVTAVLENLTVVSNMPEVRDAPPECASPRPNGHTSSLPTLRLGDMFVLTPVF